MTILTWISKLLKRRKCTHDYVKVEEVYGDKIMVVGYRSLWKCSHCDKRRKSWRLNELVE